MFPRLLLKSYRAGRKAFTPWVQGSVASLKGLAMRAGDTTPPTSATASSVAMPSGQPAKGDGEHAAILAVLEETARLGHVPADAMIGRLYTCHRDKLADDRQRLVALEQQLEAHLRGLDARFPVPTPPEPEQPQPPRGRSFGPISRDLRRMGGPQTRQ
jgi:hypothetical protein